MAMMKYYISVKDINKGTYLVYGYDGRVLKLMSPLLTSFEQAKTFRKRLMGERHLTLVYNKENNNENN